MEYNMYIYKITNLINNKIYIGKHNGKDLNYFGSGILLNRSIKKYGKENFIKNIIEYNINNEDLLNEKEKYYIKLFNSTNNKIGYNIATGGQGGFTGFHSEESKKYMSKIKLGTKPCLGIKKSEEFKKFMSEKMKGNKYYLHRKNYKLSQETKQKISKANKNKVAWNKGKKWDIVIKNKMSITRIGKYKNGENPNAKSVIFINKVTNTKIYFSTIKECCSFIRNLLNVNLNKNCLSLIINKKIKPFSYLKNYEFIGGKYYCI